jgi:hypothetical protein
MSKACAESVGASDSYIQIINHIVPPVLKDRLRPQV